MATNISFLDNFPIKFNNIDDSCLDCDDRAFCQLAQWNDTFEFAYEPPTSDVGISNPNFDTNLSGWTVGTGWTWVGGSAKASTPSGTLSQAISVTAGRKYKISFIALPVSDSPSLTITLGGVGNSVTLQGGIATYSVYIVTASTAALIFNTSSSNTLYIDSVAVELIAEDCGIKLYNTQTNAYSSLLNSNISSASFATLGFRKLWSDFGINVDGCYKIALYSGKNVTGNTMVANGNPFAGGLTSWTDASGVWVESSGKATLSTSIPGSSKLSQAISGLTIGKTYRITFTISDYIDGIIKIYFFGLTTQYISLSANGTYTYDKVYDGTQSSPTAIGFSATAVIQNDFSISAVTLFELSLCGTETLSECYNIKTTQPCTKLLKWTNQLTNGFNYLYGIFGNLFGYSYQYMRVQSDLRNSKYPGQADKYIDSGGNEILYYGSSRKQKELIVGSDSGGIPEYMHDALAIGLKHKAFYIDGIRYQFEETDYNPEWSTTIPTKLAQIKFLVGKYTQDEKSID